MHNANASPARQTSTLGRTASWGMTLALIVAGALLLTLSAKIKVPFWPVPMTMQPLAVLLLGMIGGARIGTAAVLLYLAEGAVGLPVFTDTPLKGIGLAYMMGTTGGYLAGFVLAAAATGILADRGYVRTIPSAFAVAALGMACIYAPGIAWLAQFIGADKAITFGFWPFALGDALKIALAAIAVPSIAGALAKR